MPSFNFKHQRKPVAVEHDDEDSSSSGEDFLCVQPKVLGRKAYNNLTAMLKEKEEDNMLIQTSPGKPSPTKGSLIARATKTVKEINRESPSNGFELKVASTPSGFRGGGVNGNQVNVMCVPTKKSKQRNSLAQPSGSKRKVYFYFSSTLHFPRLNFPLFLTAFTERQEQSQDIHGLSFSPLDFLSLFPLSFSPLFFPSLFPLSFPPLLISFFSAGQEAQNVKQALDSLGLCSLFISLTLISLYFSHFVSSPFFLPYPPRNISPLSVY